MNTPLRFVYSCPRAVESVIAGITSVLDCSGRFEESSSKSPAVTSRAHGHNLFACDLFAKKCRYTLMIVEVSGRPGGPRFWLTVAKAPPWQTCQDAVGPSCVK